MKPIGFGCSDFTLAVYIANTPPQPEYEALTHLSPISTGEIYSIGQACGNGWRKVFNIYAKLIFSLSFKSNKSITNYNTWQEYRDHCLLQVNSKTALLFNEPQFNSSSNTIHIICGRTYAKNLLDAGQLKAKLNWLDLEFAIDKRNRVIVCPYFDYRQLSNIKIERLNKLIVELQF